TTNEHRNSNFYCAVPHTRYIRHALLNRGRSHEASCWRSKVWRLRPGIRNPRPGTPRVTVRPTTGAAFSGWTGPDEGWRKPLDNVRVIPSGPAPEVRSRGTTNATVERREASVPG